MIKIIPHTLLWSIERYDKKLYLLGSVHIATEDVSSDKQIIQAFEESEVLRSRNKSQKYKYVRYANYIY